jgi:hypothetical protein
MPRRLVVLALAGVLVAGCGGSGPRFGKHDAALGASIAKNAAVLWQEASPLLVCAPDCNANALRVLQRDAQVRSRRATASAAALETPCLRRGMGRYAASLRGLRDFASDELSRKDSAGLAAITRSDNLRFSAIRLLKGCGYFSGSQTIGLVASLAYRRVDAASSGLERCTTTDCYHHKGRAIEKAAALGRAQLMRALGSLDSPCLERAVAAEIRLLKTYEALGGAVRTLDVPGIEHQGRRVGTRQAAVAAAAHGCLP